ncbi:hypothetical protein DXB67_04285, partial [Bacteroides caccae]|uniref:flavodoxin n=1 Tax=Bacteroides caccae TaxID=47678 RepID=UPI000ECD2A5A
KVLCIRHKQKFSRITKKSLEKPNEKGQIVIPFYTHEGSGLSDTENHLKEACSGATILKGLAIRGTIAQKS